LGLDLHELLMDQRVLLGSIRSLLRSDDLHVAPIGVPFNQLWLSLGRWLSSGSNILLNLILLNRSQTKDLLLPNLRLPMIANHWLSVDYPVLIQHFVLIRHPWCDVFDLAQNLLAVTCKLDRGLVDRVGPFKLMLTAIEKLRRVFGKRVLVGSVLHLADWRYTFGLLLLHADVVQVVRLIRRGRVSHQSVFLDLSFRWRHHIRQILSFLRVQEA